MTWYTLTHGTYAAIEGLLMILIPMWIVFRKQRAPASLWVRSPLYAVGCFVIAAIASETLFWLFPVPKDNYVRGVLSVTCLIAAGYLGGKYYGGSRVRPGHRRGSLLAQGTEAQRAAGKMKRIRPDVLTIAGVPLGRGDETKHFKILGTTGSGKSSAIHELMAGALERGDRAVIADPNGWYLAHFYNRYRGDVILNPFDARSAMWDLFAEVRRPYDIDQLVRALIPLGDTDASGREWRGYARTFVSALIRHIHESGNHSAAELWRLLTVASSDELRPLVAGTRAQPLLEPDNAKMFGSTRSVAGSVVGGLEYIEDPRDTPFCVRDWVKSGSGVLFLPYQADQIEALRGNIAAWMRLAIFEALSGAESDQPLWFVADELDALGPVDGLKDALARLRKFGGRCVLGLQSIAQVSSTYGSGDAQTIVENCANTLILRCSASEGGGTARFASDLIGEREVVRAQVSRGYSSPGLFSRGEGHTSRGVSYQNVVETAVMASEIEQLPDLTGYLKTASSPSWMKLSFSRADEPAIAQAFVPTDGELNVIGGSQTDIASKCSGSLSPGAA
jgi:type IV secretory pathway TraG/TraD family ATPase VirD4